LQVDQAYRGRSWVIASIPKGLYLVGGGSGRKRDQPLDKDESRGKGLPLCRHTGECGHHRSLVVPGG
jgi:hypothetical protein